MTMALHGQSSDSAGTSVYPNRSDVPALEARDVRMRYGSIDVLTGVDLRVEAGEVVALLGPNGAGKTTTIEILEGIRRRSSGYVRVLGVDPAHGDDEWQSRIGVVLQSWRDHRRWKVRELLLHFAQHYRVLGPSGGRLPYDTDELLDAVGLTDRAQTKVGRLSGGQRRRLDVAIGLVGNPELLFLDEPTVGFDPEARQDFHELIGSITRTRRTAVVLTTHDLVEAELLADSVAILVDGRVVARGTTEQLARRYAWGTAVSYRLRGRSQAATVDNATEFVRELLASGGSDVTDLVVRPLNLQDAYLHMIRSADPVAAELDPSPDEGKVLFHAH